MGLRRLGAAVASGAALLAMIDVTTGLDRLTRVSIIASAALLFGTFGCGGASSTVDVVGPSDTKCAVGVRNSASEIPATGATATLTVSTERECSWSARADVSWISLGQTNGQGAATFNYSVASNPAGASRRGAVTVGEQRVDVVQAAAPCQYAVEPSAVTVAAAGGSVSVNLTATSGCAWRAQPDSPWLQEVAPSEGSGNATLRFNVPANAGAARAATLRIGEAAVRVTQSAAAGPAPTPTPPPTPAPTPAPPPAPEPTPAPAPTPTPTPTPTPNCRYTVSPAKITARAAGTEASVDVATDSACAWVANTDDSWISITSGRSSSGNGTVRLAIRANSGDARSGNVAIAGRNVVVEQEGASAPCTYRLSPDSRNAGSEGSEFPVAVATQGACAWTASSDSGWLNISGSRTGTGNGSFTVTVAANSGGARTGTIRVANETVTVRQEARSCSYEIKPTFYNAGRGPDDIRVAVTAPGGCGWTASSPVAWATITEGRNGSGNGSVRIAVEANNGPERTADLTIAGEAFHLKQSAGCTPTLKPGHYNSGRGPDDIRIEVKADSGCAWTSSSSVPWVVIAEGASGSGDGTVRLLVEPNSGPDREVRLTIASQPFDLRQSGSR
jgi:hypothetical protein